LPPKKVKAFRLTHRDRQILGIALPSIVSNITVPLLGMVDVAIVGHIGNAVYIGAIAVGAMIFNLVYWIFGFLRMGTSGMTSQALGQRNLAEVTRLLVRSLLVAMTIGGSLIAMQTPLLWLMMTIIHPTADVQPLAELYFRICIWGAPAMLGIYGLNGWFIGMQNTRVPMMVAIMQNVVNIVASLTLVYVLDMKLKGVATGTLIAQYAGFLTSAFLLARHYGRLSRHYSSHGLLRREAIVRFFAVNRDIFLRTLFIVGVNLYFTSVGARQGAIILAVNTLLMQLYLLFSYVMDGFANAGEALSGKYFGAGNQPALRETIRRLFAWGTIMAIAFTLVYALGGSAFLRLLTSDTKVIAASTEYFAWAVAIPLTGMAAFIWDGVAIGITGTRQMLLSSIVGALAFFALEILLASSYGNHALWLAQLSYLAVRGIVLTVCLYSLFFQGKSTKSLAE